MLVIVSIILFALAAAAIFLYRNTYVPIWGRRRFRVSEVRRETHDTFSVRFRPADGKPLLRNPGQFMFLRLVRPGSHDERGHPRAAARPGGSPPGAL